MFEPKKTKVLLKLIVLGILIFCLKSFQNGKFDGLIVAAQTPEVYVQPQHGKPLALSSVVVDNSNPLEPKVTYLITNVSEKPIDAYAIRLLTMVGGSSEETAELRFGDSAISVLQPGQVEQGAFESSGYSKPATGFELIVDFVQFTDGSTWGADRTKSADRLAGFHAGVEAETDRLSKIYKLNGLAGVLNAIRAEGETVTPTEGRSSQWTDGFNSGVVHTLAELRRAKERGGPSAIATMLKP